MTTETRAVVRGWAAKNPQGRLDADSISDDKDKVHWHYEDLFVAGWTIVQVEIRELTEQEKE